MFVLDVNVSLNLKAAKVIQLFFMRTFCSCLCFSKLEVLSWNVFSSHLSSNTLFLFLSLQWRKTVLQETANIRTRNPSLVAHQVRGSLTITLPPTLLLHPVCPTTLPWVSLTPPTAQTWDSVRRACLPAQSPEWMNSTVHPGHTPARSPLP